MLIKSTKQVVVAQFGARKHYQEPTILHQEKILSTLYTDFYFYQPILNKLLKKHYIYKYIPDTIKKAIERYDSGLKDARIIHFPYLAYKYKKALATTKSQDLAVIYLETGKVFCKKIIKKGFKNADIIYGFNGASLELFQEAKKQNIFCILDQTLAERSFFYKLLLEEEQHWKGWAKHPFTVEKKDLELAEREQQEQYLADSIICGSDFVKDSLIARRVENKKIQVIPLGKQQDYSSKQVVNQNQRIEKNSNHLNILFAGSVSLRKGIQYLLEALNIIKGDISFTCKVAGSINIKSERIEEYQNICNFLGQVPRSKMSELYAWADVFVLPSICEGSAMVTYEAMMWGLPIITTYNSGSIVRNNIDGFIIPMRDSQEIANKLIYLSSLKFNSNKNSDTITYLKSLNSQSKQKFLECFA